jgi:hypothetical protein
MGYLTEEHKKLLGKLIDPFERSDKNPEKKKPLMGETEIDPCLGKIHDAKDNGKPKDCVTVSQEEIEKFIKVSGKFPEKCFLWVLDNKSIKMIREKTPNNLRKSKPDYVCHTNLTGGGKAYIGGEIYFGEDDNIYISWFSDRYGNPPDDLWENTKKYFEDVGYKNLIDILSILPK